MNRIFAFSLGVILLLLSACTSSNDVVSNGWIQKRKHRSGWHFDGFAHKVNAPKSASIEGYISNDLKPEEEESSEISETFAMKSKEIDRKENDNSKIDQGSKISSSKPLKVARLIRQIIPTGNHQLEPQDGIAPDEPEDDVHMLVVVSYGLMLLTLSLGFIPLLGLLLALAVLMTASLGLKQSKDKTLGKLALVLGVVLVILALAYNILLFAALFLL